MSKDKILFVGEDDGFAEVKQATSLGDTSRFPSRAKAGEMTAIALNGGQTKSFGYSTPDGNFVAGDIRDPDPTSFDDYPFSAMNRVIVSHSLRMAGIDPDTKIVMCSGLPIKRYYSGLKPDAENINRKIENLLKNDVRCMDGTQLPQIIKHYVGSEGILAWIDMVIQRKDGKLGMDRDLASGRIAIVDMGGRTTDIALIDGGELDMQKSSTINAGMLDIKEALAERIYTKDRYKAPAVVLDQAVDTGKIKIFGEITDVSAMVDECKQSVLARIHAEVKRLLNNGEDVDKVRFVGGTVAATENLIEGWFRNQEIAEDPGFANANGACKFAELQYNA